MKKTRYATSLSALLLFGAMSMTAEAAVLTYSGEVTATTGAFAALTPVGTSIEGPIEIDGAAIAGGLAGIADILAINVNFGGFCGTTDSPSSCPLGGTNVPISSIDSAALTFAGGVSTGGTLAVTLFSPTFGVSIPVFIDLTAGTIFADGGALGTVSGTGSVVAPVPAPAAAWLFGSALIGMAGLRRRR